MCYSKKIENLLDEVHQDVKNLLDPEKQKRRFPKNAREVLDRFLKKAKVRAKIKGETPKAITELAASKEDRVLVPTETLRTFFDSNDIWESLPKSVKNAIERERTSHPPNQATSDFAIHRELGDWAERAILDAVNNARIGFTAKHYGRTDRLLAGEKGFDALFQEHTEELKEIGKRPDLLLYKCGAVPNENFAEKKAAELTEFAKQANAGFEVRSSQQSMKDNSRVAKLSFTPKIEDIHHVFQWIKIHNVPHFYVQVLFGRVYAISFVRILEVLKDSPKSGTYRIESLPRNQFKSTIYIPLTEGVLLSSNFEEPTRLTATTKELSNGRIVVVVTFAGGKIDLNKEALTQLLGDAAT